jgi:nitroreductase / dihydropteridine reductase
MELADLVQWRRATKAFDPARKIPAEVMAGLETLLRFSPSSINSQPWHFVVAGTDEGKARIAQAMQGNTAYNAAKILNASHVVVFCVRREFDDAHLAAVIAQEEADGRFAGDEARAAQLKGRGYYLDMHRFERKDVQHWMEKQVYLALGTLLLGAATQAVDACPIEGFDAAVLDDVLGLRARGLGSVVVAALGYSSTADFNASLPKSRLPAGQVISRI